MNKAWHILWAGCDTCVCVFYSCFETVFFLQLLIGGDFFPLSIQSKHSTAAQKSYYIVIDKPTYTLQTIAMRIACIHTQSEYDK